MAIDLSYDPVVEDVITKTREFVRDHVLGIEEKFDGDIAVAGGDTLRLDLRDRARDLGILSPHAPIEYGGHGLNMSDRCTGIRGGRILAVRAHRAATSPHPTKATSTCWPTSPIRTRRNSSSHRLRGAISSVRLRNDRTVTRCGIGPHGAHDAGRAGRRRLADHPGTSGSSPAPTAPGSSSSWPAPRANPAIGAAPPCSCPPPTRPAHASAATSTPRTRR